MRPPLNNQRARDRLAALMRALHTNRITNLDFDEQAEEFAYGDHAAFKVFWLGAWRTYDDFREQHFTDERALTREDKKSVARWILFLKSGQSYKWPEEPGIPKWMFWIFLLFPVPIATYFLSWAVLGQGLIISIMLMAYVDRFWERMRQSKFEAAGDFDVWPFFSRADYEAALRNPPYLRGIERRS